MKEPSLGWGYKYCVEKERIKWHMAIVHVVENTHMKLHQCWFWDSAQNNNVDPRL